MTETSAGGARFYVCFKDDYSKFRRVFFITTKSEVADCTNIFERSKDCWSHYKSFAVRWL